MGQKVVIMGAGNIGSRALEILQQKTDELDIIFYDRKKDKALAQYQNMLPLFHDKPRQNSVTITDNLEDIKDAQIIIYSIGGAGDMFPSRESELYSVNTVTKKYAEIIKQHSPNALVLNISNPLDVVSNILNQYSADNNLVLGIGNSIDRNRFIRYLAEKLKKLLQDKGLDSHITIKADVFGAHANNNMVLIRDSIYINELKLDEWLQQHHPEISIDPIINETMELMNSEGVRIYARGHTADIEPAMELVDMTLKFLKLKDMEGHEIVSMMQKNNAGEMLYLGIPIKFGSEGQIEIDENRFGKSSQLEKDKLDRIGNSHIVIAKLCKELLNDTAKHPFLKSEINKYFDICLEGNALSVRNKKDDYNNREIRDILLGGIISNATNAEAKYELKYDYKTKECEMVFDATHEKTKSFIKDFFTLEISQRVAQQERTTWQEALCCYR